MARRSCKDNVCNVKEFLDMLLVDEDSDEEDFEESEPKLQETEQESDIENDEQEIEDHDTELSSLQNEDFLGTDGPSVPQQSQVSSRDGTIWNKEPPSTIGRQGKRNIISTKPGTKRFILARVNDEKDVFQELWGHQNFENVMHFTLAEAQRQEDEAFSLSKNELTAFFGLCILRGVLKGRDEPLFNFWNEEYGRPIFRETMSRNKFKSILRYIRFDDKNSRSLRRQTDKFAAIRDLWNSVMDNCQKSFFPNPNVTVDEQLFPCRAR